jgi:hypothetical protein
MIKNLVYMLKFNNSLQVEAWIIEDGIKYWSMAPTLEKALRGAYLNYYHKLYGQKI